MEDTYYNIVVLWWGSIDSYGYLRNFWVMRNIPRENAWSNAALRTNYGLYKWNHSSDYVWIGLSRYLCLIKTNYWCCKIILCHKLHYLVMMKNLKTWDIMLPCKDKAVLAISPPNDKWLLKWLLDMIKYYHDLRGKHFSSKPRTVHTLVALDVFEVVMKDGWCVKLFTITIS